MALLLCTSLVNSSNDADVCVIGAGMAGLGAATKLQGSGLSVIVLEAQHRHGGRVYTQYDTLSVPVERGAQWIHGIVDNPLTDMVTGLGAPHHVTDYDNMKVYDVDTEMTEEEMDRAGSDFDTVMNRMENLQDSTATDTSLASAFTDIYQKLGYTSIQQRYTNFEIVANIEEEYATSSEKLSLWWWNYDEELDGEDWWMPEGYGKVPDSLADECDIRYNQSVISIDYSSGENITVTSADQTQFSCGKAVVAVPLGILKNENISFTPALTAPLQHGIDHLEMGLLEKHFVEFNETFWPDTVDYIYILDQDDSRYNLSQYVEIFNIGYYIPDSNTLCLFSSGDAAYDNEKLSEADRLQHLMARLRQVFPSVPEPEAYVFSSWGNDPYTYGSYSSVGVGATIADRSIFREPVEDLVYFAGEHTSLCFPSTVHGAYLSGVNAANVLMGGDYDDLCSWEWLWYKEQAFIVGVSVASFCIVVCVLYCVYRTHREKDDYSHVDKGSVVATMPASEGAPPIGLVDEDRMQSL